MLVLSHLAVAATLAPGLALRDPAAYYLGAIIPDVRYVAGLPRE